MSLINPNAVRFPTPLPRIAASNRGMPQQIYLPGISEPQGVPLFAIGVLALAVVILAPIVRITNHLTEVGFGWVLLWVAFSAFVFVVWAGFELAAMTNLPGYWRTVAEWNLWSIRFVRWFVIAFWFLTGLSLLVLLVASSPFFLHNLLFSLTVAALWLLLAFPEPARRLAETLGAVRIPSQMLGYIVPPILASLVAVSVASISVGILVVGTGYMVRVLWCHAVYDRARGPLIRFPIILGMSFLFGWIAISTLHSFKAQVSPALPASEARRMVLDGRRAVLDGWQGAPVAVTLSGGGYRAALTHAGLLWALDQAQIPIAIVSTVSGGSIVGAAYAAGWTPAQFRDYLSNTPPGLAQDVFNFWNLSRS